MFRRAARLLSRIRDAAEAMRFARPKSVQNRNAGEMLSHMSRLLDSVTTGIISVDGGGRVRVFNAACEKLFSLPRAKVIGRPFSEIGPSMSADARGCRTLWERLSDAIWAAGAALELEYDLLQKNGARKIISYSVYPLGRMAWSLGNGVVIMLDDITRKKEMEDQISDARKRLLAVFEGITDGIQVVDSDFRITAVNKSMAALLGRDILAGTRCYESCMHTDTKCSDCPAEETFRTGLPAFVTKRLLRDGDSGLEERERCVEISTFPLLDRGNRVVQVVEYIKDVTEKVGLAERLEQSRRLAELGEMAARVAHEVRNPLNAITGAAHFLSSEYTGDETLQKFMSLIKRQAVRVNRVASDLLFVSKPLRTRLASVNVNAVLDQSLDSLCEQVRDQNIRVIHELTPDLPPVEADELQLEQAFQNLLRNAVEAMPDGGTLRLSSLRRSDGRGVEVLIQDTGPGIPEKDKERIFQSFFTTKIKGTGLGLTIVQQVLKNHHADILVDQPREGGTRILVRLASSSGQHGVTQPGRAQPENSARATPSALRIS